MIRLGDLPYLDSTDRCPVCFKLMFVDVGGGIFGQIEVHTFCLSCDGSLTPERTWTGYPTRLATEDLI